MSINWNEPQSKRSIWKIEVTFHSSKNTHTHKKPSKNKIPQWIHQTLMGMSKQMTLHAILYYYINTNLCGSVFALFLSLCLSVRLRFCLESDSSINICSICLHSWRLVVISVIVPSTTVMKTTKTMTTMTTIIITTMNLLYTFIYL